MQVEMGHSAVCTLLEETHHLLLLNFKFEVWVSYQ